jgi:hypothetical protein
VSASANVEAAEAALFDALGAIESADLREALRDDVLALCNEARLLAWVRAHYPALVELAAKALGNKARGES